MNKFFFFFIFLITFTFLYCGEILNVNEKNEIELQIKNIKDFINKKEKENKEKDKDFNLGTYYAKLGILYQASDVRWHNGGIYKPLALESFNNALKYKLDTNEHISILQRKGMLLKMMSKGNEAIDTHKEILNLSYAKNTDKSEAYVHIADAQSMLGQVHDALNSLETALQFDPNNLEVFYPMVQACKEIKCKNSQQWSELIATIEKSLESIQSSKSKKNNRKKPKVIKKQQKQQVHIDIDIDDYDFYDNNDSDDNSDDDDDDDNDSDSVNELSTSVYWALYEAGIKAENIPLAWKYLNIAHETEIKKRGSTNQQVDESERTAMIIQIFKRGFWPSGVGSNSKLPVFIIGMMRSGSTLLETILDTHPNIYGMGEDSIFNSNLPEIKDHIVQAASKDTNEVQKVVLKDSKKIVSKMLSIAKEMDNESSKQKIKNVVDKMLFNYRNIGFIHLLFPDAIILHTIRDPMDTLFSCFTQKFDDKGLEWAFKPETLVDMYIDYLVIMNHFRKELPGRVIDINYEEIIDKPEEIIKNIIVDKLELPWDEKVLNFYSSNRTVHTHSMQQVRHGLYRTSIGKWVKYQKQLEPIRKLLLPKLKSMHSQGQLPFPNKLNWLLDPNYKYNNEIDNNSLTNNKVKQKDEKSEKKIEIEKEKEKGKKSSSSNSKKNELKKEKDEKNKIVKKESQKSNELKNDKKQSKNQKHIKQKSKHDDDHDDFDEGNENDDNENENDDKFSNSKNKKSKRGKKQTKTSKLKPQPKLKLKPKPKPKGKFKLKPKSKTSFELKRGKTGKRYRKTIEEEDNDNNEDDHNEDVYKEVNHRKKSSSSSKRTKNNNKNNENNENNEKSTKKSSKDSKILKTKNRNNKNSIEDDLKSRLSQKLKGGEDNKKGKNTIPTPTISENEIKEVLNQIKSTLRSEVLNHLSVISSSLPYKTGNSFHDELASISVALYNLGRLQDCIDYSRQVLKYNKNLHSVNVALASALAMNGLLDDSLYMMNNLITQLTNEKINIGADVYERRAQILLALGDTNSSISDLTSSIKISPSINAYTSRAAAYIREQRYWDAKKDAMSAIKLGSNTAHLWNMIGRCEREFGEPEKAIAAQAKALQFESNNKDALLEMAITYMSISDSKKALEYLEKCLTLDPNFKNAHGYKGLLFQNMGKAKETIIAFRESYKIDPKDTQSIQFIAVSYQALGDYSTAIEWFEKTLQVDPDHYVWSLREIAYYRWKMLDTPFSQYNPDTDIHWLLKDAWIRRAPLRNYCGPGINPWCHAELKLYDPKEINVLKSSKLGIQMNQWYNKTQQNRIQDLVDITKTISQWIQVKSPGFLKHERQHKMFGAMVLEMAQSLRIHATLLLKGKEGLKVDNRARSRRVLIGKEIIREIYDEDLEKLKLDGNHIYGWRDMFDVAVKWRQLGEPFDTVFWIDCTGAQEDQADKVGLQTFLYHGVGKNIRYYPYFNKTFTLLRNLLPNGYYVGSENFVFQSLPNELFSSIKNARTLREILDTLQPLYVLTPLKSRATPEQGFLEGTRIAISRVSPKGENLYISTGTSYERYERYNKELKLAFNRVIEWGLETNAPDYHGMNEESKQFARDEGLKRCLELYYYWINFSPLSRGSAAVGYASIVACMIFYGDIPANPLPQGVQLDWEAILTLSPEEFISTAFPLLQDRISINSFLPICWLDEKITLNHFPSCRVSDLISTARDAIYLMNGMYEDKILGW